MIMVESFVTFVGEKRRQQGLYFGDYILFFLDENISNAQVMGDDFVCPWYVEVLKYLLFFVATVLMALAQSVWSLPQQVHIRPVIYKNLNRHKAE